MELEKLHEAMLLALVSFVLIDLILKRSLDRIAWVAEKKNENLRDVLRELVSLNQDVFESRFLSQSQKDKILSLYIKVFPGPKPELLASLQKIMVDQVFDESAQSMFKTFCFEVELVKEDFRNSTISYSGPFLSLPFSDGVFSYLSVLYHASTSMLWVPLVFIVVMYKKYEFLWLASLALSLMLPLWGGLHAWKQRDKMIRSLKQKYNVDS